jgi:hypothetical protein
MKFVMQQYLAENTRCILFEVQFCLENRTTDTVISAWDTKPSDNNSSFQPQLAGGTNNEAFYATDA